MPLLDTTQKKNVGAFTKANEKYFKGDYKGAKAAFEELLTVEDLNTTIADRCRSFIASCDTKLDDSEAKLETADEFYLHGLYCHNNADYDQAEKHFATAIKMSADNDVYQFSLACTYAAQGDRNLAVETLEKAMSINEDNKVYARNSAEFQKLAEVHEDVAELIKEEEKEIEESDILG